MASATLGCYATEASRLGSTPSSAALAASIPQYLVRLHQSMPALLRTSRMDWASVDTFVRDAHILLVGRSSEVESVSWSRIHSRLNQFEILRHFHLNSPGVSDTRMQLSRLIAKYLNNAGGQPLVMVSELDRTLAEARKGSIIADLFDAGSTIKEVVDTLLGTRDAIGTADSLGGVATTTEAPAGAAPAGGSAALSTAALERAMNSDFRETVDEADGKSGLDLLGVACSSASVLILRFLYEGTPFLVTRHEIFGALAKALSERRAHLAHSIVVDAQSGEVPSTKRVYQLTMKQSASFWSLDFENLDMVNVDPAVRSTGGFLALRFIETGAVYEPVESRFHFTTEQCLLGSREWFDGCLLGGGYSSTPDSGYTWFDTVDKQLSLIRYIGGLPLSERDGWLAWADANFREHALRRASTYARDILRSSEPGSESFGAFLPAGAEFFANIDHKLADAEPIAVVRRSFPSLFSAEPISLLGTSSPSKKIAEAGDGEGSRRQLGKNKKQAGKQGGKLACMLPSGRLFLANFSYDVAEVAKELGIDVKKKCWATLFTNKQGNDRLSVCTDPTVHGNLAQDVHKIPANFNRGAMAKKHARPATDAEREHAGWIQPKGKKSKA